MPDATESHPSSTTAASTKEIAVARFGVTGRPASLFRRWAMVALLFAVTLVAYWPALGGRLVWDDDAHVTKPALQSWAGLGRIWTDVTATQQYYPVLHSAFWIEHRLWGDAVAGYHLVTILLHATAACLFAAFLLRLAVPGAWLAAFIFALHPVHVESVAWITEQKNTLSLVLYLASALAYLRFDRGRHFGWYLAALGLFMLGLGSKTVIATLPAALLVVFWWRRGKLSWRTDVVPLVPWFAIGAMAGLFTALVERKLIGAEGSGFELSFVGRGLLAGRIVWFYLAKLFWPTELMFVYPRWAIDPRVAWQWLFPFGALALSAGLLRWRKRSRAPLAAWLIFVGSLFPVLGFFNVYPFIFSFVADHFQYVPSLAMIALTSAAAARWLERGTPPRSPVAWLIPTVVVACLGALTWRQSHVFRDAETLYRATLAKNPQAWLAANNLGVELHAAGRDAEAIAFHEQALRVQPNHEGARNNLGLALAALGRFPEAIAEYEKVLRQRPDYAEAHHNLALALTNAGRASEALAHYGPAIKAAAEHPDVYADWGFIFGAARRPAEAIAHCRQAVALGAKVASAENFWGVALANSGRLEEAIVHFERSVHAGAQDVNAYTNLGKALQMIGRVADAIPVYEAALRLQPDHAEALNDLGMALQAAGRTRDAVARFEAALRLQPNSAASHYNLALCLRELGRIDEARRHYDAARRLDPTAPELPWPP